MHQLYNKRKIDHIISYLLNQTTLFAGDQLTQERIENAKVGLSNVADSMLHNIQEADGNFHTMMTFLTVSDRIDFNYIPIVSNTLINRSRQHINSDSF